MSFPCFLRWRNSTLILLTLALTCAGQGSRRFGWKFNGQNGYSTSLPTCQDIPLLVQPFDPNDPTLAGVTGVPPYFMLALPLGGTPRLYPIGSDPQKLSWTVDFSPSTELALSIIDSNNTAGGVPSTTFKVVAGQNVGCVVQPPSNPKFTLSTNVTGEVETCAPWGVTVTGGVPPYNWTLAQLESPVVTNVTGSMNDDEMVYIMRGDPGPKLFVAASDATGQWAHGVSAVTPHGSKNVDCIGLRTVTGSSKDFAEQLAASLNKAKQQKRNKIIAIVVPVVIVSVILIGVAVWLLVRHRRKRSILRVDKFASEPKIEMEAPVSNDFSPYAGFTQQTPGGTMLTYDHTSHPNTSEGPTSPTDTSSSKAAEAYALRQSHPHHESQQTRYSQAGSSNGRSTSRFLEDDEVVIQHTDAGGVVRELPPPYADRLAPNRRPARDGKLVPQNEDPAE